MCAHSLLWMQTLDRPYKEYTIDDEGALVMGKDYEGALPIPLWNCFPSLFSCAAVGVPRACATKRLRSVWCSYGRFGVPTDLFTQFWAGMGKMRGMGLVGVCLNIVRCRSADTKFDKTLNSVPEANPSRDWDFLDTDTEGGTLPKGY